MLRNTRKSSLYILVIAALFAFAACGDADETEAPVDGDVQVDGDTVEPDGDDDQQEAEVNEDSDMVDDIVDGDEDPVAEQEVAEQDEPAEEEAEEPAYYTGDGCHPDHVCEDVTGEGHYACTDNGGIPAENPDNCENGPDCPQDYTCYLTGSGSICLKDCESACNGACGDMTYNACTCAADDPCGWAQDGYCDATCAEQYPDSFDDGNDCPLTECSGDLSCSDVFKSGEFYCLNSDVVPQDAVTGCHDQASCADGLTCVCTEGSDHNCQQSACLQSCEGVAEDGDIDEDVEGTVLTFADEALERCILDELVAHEGVVTQELADTIEVLNCPDYGIENITGIDALSSLRDLSLWENPVADIGPLSTMTHLRRLNLGLTGIADISALSGLTDLETLDISQNAIEDIADLAALTALTHLNLGGNLLQTDDLPGLCTLTNLVWLTVEHNRIDDASALSCISGDVYAEMQDATSRRLATGFAPALPAITAPAQRLNREPGDITMEILANNRLNLSYRVAGHSYPLMREYAGNLILEGNEIRLETRSGLRSIGTRNGDTVELCTGAYAEACSFALGHKHASAANMIPLAGVTPQPVYSLSISLARDGKAKASRLKAAPGMVASSHMSMIPYVLASPNQLDAGSCLFMANTGAMEILVNQHTPLEDISYDGDTDFSERWLMNASDLTPRSLRSYYLTDTLYTFNHFGGGLLNRDYRYTAGYVKETVGGGIIKADPNEEGAYFSLYYNWINELPNDWQSSVAATPPAERTVIFVDPLRNDNSKWNVGLMNDDIVERIKRSLREKNAPVIVIYNHYLYWHADIVVGYDDAVDIGGCPMVESTLSYFEEKDATAYVSKIENHMAQEGGCGERGVFYVRDSIYDGGRGEPMYNYSDQYNFEEKYSKRIIARSYDWVKYLANHAYSYHRK